MSRTDVQHGALVFIRKNNRRVGYGKDPRVSIEGPLVPVEPIGQPHPEEYLRVASEVRLDFSLYRQSNKSITQQGFFPSMSDAKAFIEGPEITIQIENTDNVILHRISGFKVESVDVSYTKGEPSMYQLSGRGIRHEDEADI